MNHIDVSVTLDGRIIIIAGPDMIELLSVPTTDRLIAALSEARTTQVQMLGENTFQMDAAELPY